MAEIKAFRARVAPPATLNAKKKKKPVAAHRRNRSFETPGVSVSPGAAFVPLRSARVAVLPRRCSLRGSGALLK